MVLVGKASLSFMILLLGLGCSHGVSPGGGGGGGRGSTLAGCQASSDCTQAGEVCDLLYPSQSSGKPGTCRVSCNPAASQACSNGEVCNPITAACEPSCSTGSCQNSVAGGANSICTADKYCAVLATGPCPNQFSPSGGFCKLSNSVSQVPNLTLDLVTNTWEIGCSTAQDNCAAQLKNLQISSSSNLSYACSPVTATCVQSCVPGGSCVDSNRNFCSGIQNTCEFSCLSTACPSSTLKCADINSSSPGSGGQPTSVTVSKICVIDCPAPGPNKCPGEFYCQGKSKENQFCQPGMIANQFSETAPTSCGQHSECPSDQVCDVQFPSGNQSGTCVKPSSTSAQCSGAGLVFSPITNMCEPGCLPLNGIDPCQSRLAAPGEKTGQCSSTNGVPGYCKLGCTASTVSKDCPSNFSCLGGFCEPDAAQKAGCGDGAVAIGELCDEGQIGRSCGFCPSGWSCSSGQTVCAPNNSDAGNGQPGHCSNTCGANNTRAQCAVYVDYTKPQNGSGDSFKSSVPSIGTSGALSLLSTSAAPTDPAPVCPTQASIKGNAWIKAPVLDTRASDCPCGYGIWVKGNTPSSSESFPIEVSYSTAIYGGFKGSEKSIYDRVDALGKPLGQNAFSDTVLPVGISIGDDVTTINVTLDGFQITGVSSTSATNACNSKEQGGGAMTVCKSATASLQRLRISNNKTTGSGGGIRVLGTLTSLKDSFISVNKAQVQGGGLSLEGTGTTTIERTTFYGNGFASNGVILNLWPTCTSGYSAAQSNPQTGDNGPRTGNNTICPTGMTCLQNGGYCTGTPTCTSTQACPAGWTCPPGTGTTAVNCTGGPVPPTNSTTSGGAIANTGTGELDVFASRIQGNWAYGYGGGIYSNAQMTIAASLFAGNRASLSGGGVYQDTTGTLTLDTSTLIDNEAYNQGGGGVFYYTANPPSIITNSLFRNNRGLYPRNNNNMAEWAGNRLAKGSGSFNQVNSISNDKINWGSNIMLPVSLSGVSYVDMCPVMSYNYGDMGMGSGVCNGTQICGTFQKPVIDNITFDVNVYPNTNTCSLQEFVDCTAPLYRDCGPVGYGLLGNGQGQQKFKKDILGNDNKGSYKGAYQSIKTCTASSELPSNANQCKNGFFICQHPSAPFFRFDAHCPAEKPFCSPTGECCKEKGSQCESACSGTSVIGWCPEGLTCKFSSATNDMECQ